MYLLYKTTYYNLLAYKCYNDGYDSLCAFFCITQMVDWSLGMYSDYLAYISFFYYRLYMFLY